MTSKGLRCGLLACLLVMLASVLSLAPYLTDSTNLVRMRNALVMDFGAPASFDWTPATMPPDFALERGPIDEKFKERVAALHLQELPSDWERALALGRHLLENRRESMGGAIQADLEETYQVIRATGHGYCGDFSDVYAALALAAGLHVRSWAFSFDGFGGWGHVYNEVWDTQAGRWRAIDVFNNVYFAGQDGQPLSALELREYLGRHPQELRVQPVDAKALPGFGSADKALAYYRRGLHEWYLWWGNAVYTYDQAWLVRTVAPLSRSLEQLGGIAQGVYPHIRVLAEPGNRAQLDAMKRLWLHLMLVVVSCVLAALATCVLLWRAVRRRTAALVPISDGS